MDKRQMSGGVIATIFMSILAAMMVNSHLGAAENQIDTSVPVAQKRPIRAEVNLVLINLSAIDSENRLIAGLKPHSFQVLEDGKPQDILYFSTEDAPVSVVIVFDVSKSMAVGIENARSVLSEFLRKANPQDEFSLILFGDRPYPVVEFAQDITPLLSKANSAYPKGSTALYDAVYLGLNELRKAKSARKALLVISDGGDNHSRYTAADILRAAKESDAQIYSIGVQDPFVQRRFMQEAALQDMARVSGGRYFRVEGLDSLENSTTQISRELHSFYVLGYRSTNGKSDGRWRSVRVRLISPELKSSVRLYHRYGYYAPQ